MINILTENTPAEVKIELSGEMIIDNAKELYTSFKEAIIQSDKIVIDQSAVEEFDFTYVQNLLSFLKTASDFNKKIILIEKNCESFDNLLKDSGFNNNTELQTIRMPEYIK